MLNRFKVGAATDIGRKRSQNQDNFVSVPELGLFVVADGMGGHQGGEIASAMVVEKIPPMVRADLASKKSAPRDVIARAIASASRAVYERAAKEPKLHGMGTTTVALLFQDDRLTIGHVGDSRAYFFQPNAIWQATRDHSLVQEKLRAGLITRDEVKNDRMKNVITRSVGFEPEVNVEIYEMEVRPGDVFMICSDGLSGLVEDSGMLSIVQETYFSKSNEARDPQLTVEKLIAGANANGGDDNITSVMVEIL